MQEREPAASPPPERTGAVESAGPEPGKAEIVPYVAERPKADQTVHWTALPGTEDVPADGQNPDGLRAPAGPPPAAAPTAPATLPPTAGVDPGNSTVETERIELPVPLTKSRPGPVAVVTPPPAVVTPPPVEPVERGRPSLRFLSQVLAIVAAVALGFLIQLTILGSFQHDRDQAQAFAELRILLADGRAPVGPVDLDDKLLPAGAPVGILEIPRLKLQEVILEGATSRVTMSGVGHRRDSVLPGQVGTSLVLGRRGGYGGPFRGIDTLRPEDEIIVTTGQGRHTFRVIGLRHAGDPLPPTLKQGQGRLTLITTDGPTFQPTDVVRVDADLTSQAQERPQQIPTGSAPDNEGLLAGDSSALLSLVLWGPLVLAAAAGVVWVRYRAGRWQSWIIGIPVLGLLGLIVIDNAIALLPNVL